MNAHVTFFVEDIHFQNNTIIRVNIFFLRKRRQFTWVHGHCYSDFTRWLCHPRNKQKGPVGARGLRWQLLSAGTFLPEHPQKLFINIDTACSELWTAGVVQQTPQSHYGRVSHHLVSLFFSPCHFQNYYLSLWFKGYKNCYLIRNGHNCIEKIRKRAVLMQIMAVQYYAECKILQTGNVTQSYLTPGQETDTSPLQVIQQRDAQTNYIQH